MCIPQQLSWKLAGAVMRTGRADPRSLLVTHWFPFPLGGHRPVLGGPKMCLCGLTKQSDKLFSECESKMQHLLRLSNCTAVVQISSLLVSPSVSEMMLAGLTCAVTAQMEAVK